LDEKEAAVLTEDQLEIMKKRRVEMKGKGRKGRRKAPKKDVQSDETTDG
jgi:peptide subunit release factor 1 (eRF1)